MSKPKQAQKTVRVLICLINNMATQISSKQLILFFLGEINKMRSHPKAFLTHLKERLDRFDQEKGKTYTRSDIPSIVYKTVEGEDAVKEAYNFLLSQEPLQPLELSYQLSEAAFVVGGRISRDRQPSDILAYQKDLTTELSNNHCTVQSLYVIIQYGFREDYQLVPSIIIDDGDQSRSQRKALMNDKYKYIGLAVHQHREFDYQLFILLADDVQQIEIKQDRTCQCQLI